MEKSFHARISCFTQIANNESGCIKMTIPPSVDTGDVELLSVGGETFVNLPSNPLISPDLSKYGKLPDDRIDH
jgi:hypothetical protein